MTRTMFILAAVLFVVMIVSFVAGIASMSAGPLMLALFVAGPLFTFCLAFGLGRASSDFVETVRVGRAARAAQTRQVNGRVSRIEQREREVLG